MQSSAQILVQRYLEDDLNDYERQAFVDDMSRDPQLAALLEQEAQLDHSIINDAYSIEPPTAIRAAVLAAITASPEPVHQVSRPIALSSVLATLVSLWFTVIGTSHNDLMRNAHRPDTSVSSAVTKSMAAIAPSQLPTIQLSSRTVVPDEPAKSATSEVVELAEQPESRIQRVEIEPATMNVLKQQHSQMQLSAVGLFAAESFPVHGLSGIAAPSSFGLRYDVASFDALRLFVEGGAMVSVQAVQQFSNGIAQQTSQQSTMPFIVFGAEARIAEVPVLQRALMGSAAIGVSALGPMAIADLTAEVTKVGPFSIYAGVRITGMTNTRGETGLHFDSQPFMRIAYRMP
jgi:hypothetical protein